MDQPLPTLLSPRLARTKPTSTPPHHVLASSSSSTSWTSYLPSFNPSPAESRPRREGLFSSFRKSTKQAVPALADERTGFRNPWPSWHKPTQKETWDNLEWGEDVDPCIELVAGALETPPTAPSTGPTRKGSKGKTVLRKRPKELRKPGNKTQQAAALLKVVKTDFTFDASTKNAKVTWLGHAGMLVQLPSLSQEGGRPLRCVFDPIFSQRASPTQSAGPTRHYPTPCQVEELPMIDAFFLSHSHFDHLDYDTVMAIWRNNKETIRFLVPLGNKKWFVESGIPDERVHELDWWDAIYLSPQPGATETQCLKVVCTPSQHQSGRTGLDTDTTLWSSWFLEHPMPGESPPYRVFFAGDTGYQFHASPQWPPSPPTSTSTTSSPAKEPTSVSSGSRNDPNYPSYPPCPAFQDIVNAHGSPDLLLLPIWVGGTYDFVRSWAPLSDALNPIPRHKLGLTAANHMPPWDAVRVLRLMTEGRDMGEGEVGGRNPIAVAMHWGTFITEPVEQLLIIIHAQPHGQDSQTRRFLVQLTGLPYELHGGTNVSLDSALVWMISRFRKVGHDTLIRSTVHDYTVLKCQSNFRGNHDSEAGINQLLEQYYEEERLLPPHSCIARVESPWDMSHPQLERYANQTQWKTIGRMADVCVVRGVEAPSSATMDQLPLDVNATQAKIFMKVVKQVAKEAEVIANITHRYIRTILLERSHWIIVALA
ncbi:Uu.00g041520.m01.CDS01 [Anthostomella pinea]|uniref:Uu.00g041520.m01.CDS01 n=1 Tax=Anthostomella pinea TaxID=933095 RepID=A0AAI8YBM4_9PEZI|nr:Uu.00g041520.m01.CDS01 [Anthostomella pinea]